MSSAAETVTLVARELESQSLNAVVAGFSFAAALSWMDLVRWTVNQVVKVNKNGGMNYTLTALFTTLLSILVYVGISRVSTRVQKPTQPIFAVTR
jgi:galactokinase/mevalonate kinase-like predicted kinase